MTLNLNTILFPTDFSDVAEGAFAHAAHLALRYNATIHVFHVVSPGQEDASPNPMDFLPVEPAAEAETSESNMQYVNVETVTDEQGTVPVAYVQTDRSSPTEAILDYAEEHDMDLVVMGTHGRRGMDRLLGGSVAEEVVRRASCPVFTVLTSDQTPSTPSIRRVLAPVDLSDQSKLVLQHAGALSEAYAATLDLLHIVEETAYPNVYGLDPLTPSLPNVQDRAREALEALAAELDLRMDPVNVHVLAGHAARDIVEFAGERAVDLIVMATHGRTGLERFLIGSVAEKVVRGAPCPVFTIKSFRKSLIPHTDEGVTGEDPDETE